MPGTDSRSDSHLLRPTVSQRKRLMKRLPYLLCLIWILMVATAAPARADIFQWEYVNPADPGQGKQQSTTLCARRRRRRMPCRARTCIAAT